MSLKAVLTVGWRDDVAAPGSAQRLFERARARGDDRAPALDEILGAERPRVIHGLDRLFRRRVGGFGPVQSVTAALAAYAASGPEDVYCQVDAFAYAFLVAAKNFDFLLPEETRPPAEAEPEASFRRVLPEWQAHLSGLHEFERVGRPVPEAHRRAYLPLRRVLGRGTARDERCGLAALLVSGPSTREQVSRDLGLSYSLGDRVFGALEEAGAVERSGDVFAVREEALPTVIFVLGATLGMDPLGILGAAR